MKLGSHTNRNQVPWTRFMLLAGLVLGLTLNSSCATSFTGSAHYGGPQKCYQSCKRHKMRMAGYVFMGEYSSACICRLKRKKKKRARRATLLQGASGAMSGTAAAVITQMRRAAEAHRRRRQGFRARSAIHFLAHFPRNRLRPPAHNQGRR